LRKPLLIVTLVVVLLSTLLITACGEKTTAPSTSPSVTKPAGQTTTAAQATTNSAPKAGGKFTFISDRSPAGNIGWPPETFTMVPQYYLYNSLVKAWWNGDITADLATSWEVDPKAPSITFHLRKGVKFHDGSDFNAKVVKFNYDPMIEAKKRSDWKSVEVIDDYTVRLNLTNWRNTILSSMDGNPVVSQVAVEKNGKDWIKLNPVGTGPFQFVSFVQDDRMVLKKNPNYWDTGLPYFDTIEIIYVPDYITRKAAMQKKEGDMMLVEFGKEAADFSQMKNIELFVQPQATAYMLFDDLNSDSPFYNQKVREAVDYAIDRKWLADNLGFGYWQPCYQLQPRNNVAYNPNYKGREYDVAKAKQLLTDAGYPTGFKTELLPNPTSLNKDLWVAIQSQLAKVGIDASLKFLEVAKFDEYRNTGTWKNAILGDNMPAYGNMNQSIVQNFDPGAEFYKSMNKARPDFVEAVNAASMNTTYDSALTRKAFESLYTNASVVPVAEGGRGYVFQSYVKDGGYGKRGAYFWAWDWEHAWLDK
jgi:peptide/nickel transport system substrate-binding protein